MSSHLLSYDPKIPTPRPEGVTFVFDRPDRRCDRHVRPVLHIGLNGFTDYFMDSDFLGNPLTIYPSEHFEDRGLELNKFDDFTFSVAGDRLDSQLGMRAPPATRSA